MLGKWIAGLLVFGAYAAGSTGLAAPPETSLVLWDAFVVVDGQLLTDGMIRGCANPAARVMQSGHCMVPGLIATMAGKPEIMGVQQFLEMAVGSQIAGKRPVAVGVLPHWKSSGGKNPSPVLANDQFVIVYKLTTP